MVLFQKERRPYEFLVQNNTLTIQPTKTKWYQFLRMGIDHSEIKLLVPNSAVEALSVKANVGRVDIHEFVCNGTMAVQANTGEITLASVSCKGLALKGNTGCVSLNHCKGEEGIAIQQNTGKVLLNQCFAPKISVKTNTGKVQGKLPHNMVFNVRTTTGKIQVPQPPVGETVVGRCEIKTNTGNITFE